MSLSVQEIVRLKFEEAENLKRVAEAYPDAHYVRGRLYEVYEFLPDDKPNQIVIEEGLVCLCVIVGDPNAGGIFVRESLRDGLKPEIVVSLIFRQNPEAVLKVLRG